MAKSIEEQVEDWCKNQLEKYFTKTESINFEIDEALKKAPAKKGDPVKIFPTSNVLCPLTLGTFPSWWNAMERKGTL